MSKNEWKRWVGVAGRLLLGYALILSQCALAGQNPKTTDKANSPQRTSARTQERPSGNGSHEGIKVHGHWTIEVRNPDGTLVTHREFENSLSQSTGGALLASLLNSHGQLPNGGGGLAGVPPFYWGVVLNGTPGPCGSGAACIIAQALSAAKANCNPFVPDSQSLTAAAPAASSPNAGSFVLSGTVVATTNSSITGVGTKELANVAVDPSNCTVPLLFGGVGVALYQFTDASISPINVVAGQTIAVTVIISFS